MFCRFMSNLLLCFYTVKHCRHFKNLSFICKCYRSIVLFYNLENTMYPPTMTVIILFRSFQTFIPFSGFAVLHNQKQFSFCKLVFNLNKTPILLYLPTGFYSATFHQGQILLYMTLPDYTVLR